MREWLVIFIKFWYIIIMGDKYMHSHFFVVSLYVFVTADNELQANMEWVQSQRYEFPKFWESLS